VKPPTPSTPPTSPTPHPRSSPRGLLGPVRKAITVIAALALALGLSVFAAPGTANAHGVTMMPGSRTYLCWVDGLTDTGQIIPTNPACADAVADSGTTPLYNWFAVLNSNAAGRTEGYIPDGRLCSGGNVGPFEFGAYDAARTDWPTTHLTSGAQIQIQHSNWAHHPGEFIQYVTRDGWDPTQPLAWSDLEPFHSETDPPQSSGPGGNGYYYWDVTLPAGKTGQHLIFTLWVRSDSPENFYSCADVVFDGGNGEVTGVRDGADFSAISPGGSGHTHEPANAAGQATQSLSSSSQPLAWWLLGGVLALAVMITLLAVRYVPQRR